MDLSGRQSRKTSVVLKWMVFLTVFSLGFIVFLNTHESFWLRPLSERVALSDLADAALFQGEVADESGQETNFVSDETDLTPKVAMLFLTRGLLPHEALWRAFFEAASTLSLRHPPPDLNYLNSIAGEDRVRYNRINKSTNRRLSEIKNRRKRTGCPAEEQMMESEIKRLMKVADDPSLVISSQLLFNVYSHPKPTFQFPATSIFYQTEVKDRINTSRTWGKFKLVAAELRLIKAALKDTNNKKLILLSESCIPLYPPEVIYAQLMSEQKSRMKSCGNPMTTRPQRFTPKMTGKYFKKRNWRKNSQWFALNRAHAEVVMNETYVKRRFKRFCNGSHGERFCPADEHYIPSTLNAYGLGNQTDCNGVLTFSKFHRGPHPVTFGPSSIRPALLLALRHTQPCAAGTAKTTAAALLDGLPRNSSCNFRKVTVFKNSNETDVSRNWVVKRGYEPLKYRCVLFARKFPSVAVRITLRASLSCSGGSLGYWC